MSKEITKAFILQEIQDKFKLREFEHEKFIFSETVIPVYNIEQHLEKYEVVSVTESIITMGTQNFFIVPPNERWTLRAYQVIFGATGPHKGTGLYITKRPGASDTIYLDMKLNQEVSYLINLPVPVALEPGNELSYYIDTYVSTQDLMISIDVMKEEIR